MTTHEKIEGAVQQFCNVWVDPDHDEALKELLVIINQAIIEELDEALLSVNYFSRQKNLNDKEVMLSVTRYLRGRIKTFKEEL